MNENNWLSGGSGDVAYPTSILTSSASSANDSSILRTSKLKQNQLENPIDDLLIFGYACKIFRDDDKARYIDQGKHLIPWMGDNSLKIDRYDVRGALSDISKYEAPAGGYGNRMNYLSAEEQRAEQLCEHERYYSLYNNDVEEELYKEEELKRFKACYGQIEFDYDAETSKRTDNWPENPSEGEKDEDSNEPDEIYVPHPKFIIPADIELPETVKLHAIIEKTTKFISTQGPQMEILIKAKQSNNPQFEFLNRNSRLNNFYKHMLQCMKNGTYPEDSIPTSSADNSAENTEEQNASNDPYTVPTNYPMIQVPTLKYKPSADCAYTQLISKIKGVPILTEEDLAGIRESSPGTQSPNPNFLTASSTTIKTNEKLPKVPTSIDVEVKKISTGLMLAHYYGSDSETEDEEKQVEKSTTASKHQNETVNEESQSSLPLISQEDESKLGIPYPPPDLKVIIDKTAAYVLKNGKEFEDILRTKNDERFTFLQYTDQYYKYYTYKVTGVICPTPPPAIYLNNGAIQISLTEKLATLNTASKNEYQTKKTALDKELASSVITPVSFSIKLKDEAPGSLPLKPALPQDQSSEEEEVHQENSTNASKSNQIEPTNTTISTNPQTTARSGQFNFYPPLPTPHCHKIIENTTQFNGSLHKIDPQSQSSSTNVSLNVSRGSDVDQSESFIRDIMLEQQNIEERKEAKRAEDKVKDRLAQLAREKLGILSKEKQLQLERKRRAMAFLNQVTAPKSAATGSASTSNSLPLTSTTTLSALDKIRNEHQETDSGSDSSDSVTIVSSSSIGTKRPRNLRTNNNDDDEDDDDVIEIIPIHSGSRSRSKSTSSKHHSKHKKLKHSKKKSKQKTSSSHTSQSHSRSRNRSRSRSRSRTRKRSRSRSYLESHHKNRDKRRRKRSPSKSKKRKRRYSSDR